MPPACQPLGEYSVMNAMDQLLSRVSTDRLHEPAPTAAQLEQCVAAALRAPDHGYLRPWRYGVVTGDARAQLAERVVASLLRVDPAAPQAAQDKRRQRFSTMPMTLVLGMRLRPDHKIPVWEQEMTVAAGVMNLLNALHAQGFGAIWVSGPPAQDPVLAAELGFAAPDRLAGFVFVGTPETPLPAHPRPDAASVMTDWQGGPLSFAADRG